MMDRAEDILILVRQWRIIGLSCSSLRPASLPVKLPRYLLMMNIVNCNWLYRLDRIWVHSFQVEVVCGRYVGRSVIEVNVAVYELFTTG